VTFVASTWLAPLLAYISGNYGKVVAHLGSSTTGAASSAAAGRGSPRGSGNWLARNFDWICSHWNGYGFIALRMV